MKSDLLTEGLGRADLLMAIDHGIDKTETELTRLQEQKTNLIARAEKWQEKYDEFLKPVISEAMGGVKRQGTVADRKSTL